MAEAAAVCHSDESEDATIDWIEVRSGEGRRERGEGMEMEAKWWAREAEVTETSK